MKAASEHYMGGAELAERLHVTAPLWVVDDSPWADKTVMGQLKIASELMNLENDAVAAMPTAIDRSFINEVQQPTTDTAGITKQARLGHIMQALVNANCMLPVQDFLMLVGERGPEKTAQAADLVASRLPGIYNRLASDPELEQALRINPYLPSGVTPPRRIRDWVAKHAHAWSLDRDRIIERLQLSVLRQPAPPELRTFSKEAADVGVDALAREYALYQLAFLQSRADSPEAALTCQAVIRHNYIK
jgi:hypothetical protein